MMKKENVYFPRDEIRTTLLPVTIGCAHNECAFCTMYRDDPYSIVPLFEVEIQLKNMDLYTERIFITSGDPLSIGYEKMKEVLDLIGKYLPYCAGVASYASVRSIKKYTVEELSILHHSGLRLLYMGFESGYDEALNFMKKGYTSKDAIEEAKKLNEAQIPFNTVIVIGMAGKGKSLESALATAEMINQFETNKVYTMNLTVFHGTELDNKIKKEEFELASGKERLIETMTLLRNLNKEKRTLFDTTHPANVVSLKGYLPDEKDRLMKEIMRYHD